MDGPCEEVLWKDRQRRKKRIRLIILACLVLIPLLTYLETRVVQLGTIPFPVSGNVLIFVLINFNVLLLLLMVFLVLRNLAQLVFERRRRFLGTKLRSKLVIAFVSMSFFPTCCFLSLCSLSLPAWITGSISMSPSPLKNQSSLPRMFTLKRKTRLTVRGVLSQNDWSQIAIVILPGKI